jgi:hypothetical protein
MADEAGRCAGSPRTHVELCLIRCVAAGRARKKLFFLAVRADHGDAHRRGQGGELEPGGCCRRPASNRQPLDRVLEGQGGAMGCAWSWARLLAPPLELVLALVLVLAWCRRISACLRAFARRCSSQMASMANAGARASRMVVVGRYNNALSSCSARPAICTSSLSPTRTSFSTSLVELLAYHEPTALPSRNQPNASAAREYHLPPHGQEAVCCWQDGGNSRQARVLLLVHVDEHLHDLHALREKTAFSERGRRRRNGSDKAERGSAENQHTDPLHPPSRPPRMSCGPDVLHQPR